MRCCWRVPLRPGAIVLGKLIAALTHLFVLILGSLPIIMLCLPLGGCLDLRAAGGLLRLAGLDHSLRLHLRDL